jgi:hypothetical protein
MNISFDKSSVRLFKDNGYNKHRISMLIEKSYLPLSLDERVKAWLEGYHMFKLWSNKTGKKSFISSDGGLIFFDKSDLYVSSYHALCHIERDRLQVDYEHSAVEIGIDWAFWSKHL